MPISKLDVAKMALVNLAKDKTRVFSTKELATAIGAGDGMEYDKLIYRYLNEIAECQKISTKGEKVLKVSYGRQIYQQPNLWQWPTVPVDPDDLMTRAKIDRASAMEIEIAGLKLRIAKIEAILKINIAG